ncbi:class I SAM-dependent methyltransferase [Alcanivorax sp. 1008]|uniref:class I SAM-dependent methyltransferase n=1 Tax=Alcanivorax sp. 1008 TaxID=2816853 RepID=UPI001DC77B6F|nr:class I SAM-dependent methyltransferase [Alcanivorax sp. 1008]MCC1498324.1 class I SAM-dependent methyltransferase [Alcanivorax sp. 1008]
MICPLCLSIDSTHFANADDRDYFRCPRCQLTFLAPEQLPDAAAERAHYGLHENDPADPRYCGWLSQLAAPLDKQLIAPSKGLDYGCGPGPALAQMMQERGHSMAVYDPIFAPDSSVLNQQYDFVTCTEVVEHFHQPAREFERLTSLLTPTGVLAIMTSLLDDGVDFHTWHYRRDPTHVCFYRRETFIWIAAHFGMSTPGVIGSSVVFLGHKKTAT